MSLPMVFSMEVSSIYIALCGILIIVLATFVVRGRRSNQVGIGDGDVKSLRRAIRVHGNATEYIPIALLLLVAVENTGAANSTVHILGLMLVVGRLLHAAGLSKSGGTSAPRLLGTMATWLMILVSSIIVLVAAF